MWNPGLRSWILLLFELINPHSQAVIRSLWDDVMEIGCILEESVLSEVPAFSHAESHLYTDEERIVLLAMHRILV